MQLMLSPQITCRKINGLWSFDEQFRDGSYVTNEPLMHQATALIDKVLLSKYETIPEEIEITYDIDPIYEDSADIILEFQSDDGEASFYKDKRSGDVVWLCPVLQRMDAHEGMKPQILYVYVD